MITSSLGTNTDYKNCKQMTSDHAHQSLVFQALKSFCSPWAGVEQRVKLLLGMPSSRFRVSVQISSTLLLIHFPGQPSQQASNESSSVWALATNLGDLALSSQVQLSPGIWGVNQQIIPISSLPSIPVTMLFKYFLELSAKVKARQEGKMQRVAHFTL